MYEILFYVNSVNQQKVSFLKNVKQNGFYTFIALWV